MLRRPVLNWSIGLGRLGGVALEVHLTLLLGFALVLAFTAGGSWVAGFVAIAVWFLSVAIHDLAHAISAKWLGGRVEVLVLGPVGGLRVPQVPEEPEPQVLVAIAGLIAHLSLVVVAAGLLVFHGPTDVMGLLTTLLPSDLFATSTVSVLLVVKMTLWMNWWLFLVNWLPVYPFDAAPALRALLWPVVGRRSSVILTTRLGLGVSAFLLFLGLYFFAIVGVGNYLWASLLLLALFSAFSALRDLALLDDYELDVAIEEDWNAKQSESDDEELLPSDSGHMVLVEQHRDQRREWDDRQRKAREDYDDARVDDILARLHDDGFDRLPIEDQSFLRRASERYRDRRKRDP